jgi:hypothetical protein
MKEIAMENKPNPDVFVDFKGWRFRPPFRCMCCGTMISLEQFCFGRACALCDTGRCNHPKTHKAYSGPRELMNRKDPLFISEDRWLNPPTGLASHPDDAAFNEQRVSGNSG